jgi:glutamine---fructose-6-phosphate transaminase (isomerizing)
MTSTTPRSAHPYHMHDAIRAQPDALRRVVRENAAALDDLAARLGGIERVALAGIGTSWHAALVGELLLAQRGRLGHRVRAFHSFDLPGYWPDFDARTAVIVVTHGGAGRLSGSVLDKARASGGLGVALTGKGHDDLPDADVTLRTVEQERSSAHTVSYTTALTLLAGLAARLGPEPRLGQEIDALPELVAQLLGQQAWHELGTRDARRRCYWVLGGGPNTPTALEIALKLNEAAHAPAFAHGTEQFLHGPWAAVERDDVVLLVAPPGPGRDRSLRAARAAREIGARVVVLAGAGDAEARALASDFVTLPDVDELLSPIVAVVPLQLFTYHVAVARGVNPDIMRTDEAPYAAARVHLT